MVKKFLLFVLCCCASFCINSVSARTCCSDIYTEVPDNIDINENGDATLNVNFYEYGVPILGDVDGDLVLDIDDIEAIINYNKNDGSYVPSNEDEFKKVADVDKNNVVDQKDANILLKRLLYISNNLVSNNVSKTKLTVNPSADGTYVDSFEVKYAVFNADSKNYNKIKEYYNMANKTTVNDNYNIVLMNKADIFGYNSVLDESLTESNDMSTIKINVGKTKTDKIYLFVYSNLGVSNSIGNWSTLGDNIIVKEYDVSNFDWDTYLNNSVEETVVENPNTGIQTVSIIALVTVSLLLVLKRKNKFKNI